MLNSFVLKPKLKNNYLKNMKLTEFLDKEVRIGAVFENFVKRFYN